MREYEAYIFDFDMTLFNSLKGVELAYAKAFRSIGVPFNVADCRRYVQEPLDVTADRFVRSEAEKKRFIDSFIAESRASMASRTDPYPETEEVIGTLHSRGKGLSIASGKMRERIVAILLKHGLLERFDRIVGYDDVKNHKPAPDGLLNALNEYPWLEKKDVCYVGDSPGDMFAAEGAGIDGIYVPRGPVAECPYTFMIRDLRDLM
ncbi:MAG: HAD family hydrolase [Candidatus Methanomethylophilaceae archaeon]|nr:HAD-IA family hydrolase [Candidatus Methanomethylophilaceae archaeon]